MPVESPAGAWTKGRVMAPSMRWGLTLPRWAELVFEHCLSFLPQVWLKLRARSMQ